MTISNMKQNFMKKFLLGRSQHCQDGIAQMRRQPISSGEEFRDTSEKRFRSEISSVPVR